MTTQIKNVEILILKRDAVTGVAVWKHEEWLTWEEYIYKADTMPGEGEWWRAVVV